MGTLFKEAKHLVWYNPEYDDALRDDSTESDSLEDEEKSISGMAEWSSSSGIITGTENDSKSSKGHNRKRVKKGLMKNPDLFHRCETFVEAQVNEEGFDPKEKRKHQRIPFSWPPEKDRASGLLVSIKKPPPKVVDERVTAQSKLKDVLSTLLIEGLEENADLIDSKLKDILSTLHAEEHEDVIEPAIQFRKSHEMDVPFVIHLEARTLSNDTGLGCPSTLEDNMRGDAFGSLLQMYSSNENSSTLGLQVWVKTSCVSKEFVSSREVHSETRARRVESSNYPLRESHTDAIDSAIDATDHPSQSDLRMQELLRKSGRVVPTIKNAPSTSECMMARTCTRDSIDQLDFEKVKKLYDNMSSIQSIAKDAMQPRDEMELPSNDSVQMQAIQIGATLSETPERNDSSAAGAITKLTRSQHAKDSVADVTFEKVKIMYDRASVSRTSKKDIASSSLSPTDAIKQPNSTSQGEHALDSLIGGGVNLSPANVDESKEPKLSSGSKEEHESGELSTNGVEVELTSAIAPKKNSSQKKATAKDTLPEAPVSTPNPEQTGSLVGTRKSKTDDAVFEQAKKLYDELSKSRRSLKIVCTGSESIGFSVEPADESRSMVLHTRVRTARVDPDSSRKTEVDTIDEVAFDEEATPTQVSPTSSENAKPREGAPDDFDFETVKKLYDSMSASGKLDLKPIAESSYYEREASKINDRSTLSTSELSSDEVATTHADATAVSPTLSEKPRPSPILKSNAETAPPDDDYSEGVTKSHDEMSTSGLPTKNTKTLSKESCDDSKSAPITKHEASKQKENRSMSQTSKHHNPSDIATSSPLPTEESKPMTSLSGMDDFEVVKKLYDRMCKNGGSRRKKHKKKFLEAAQEKAQPKDSTECPRIGVQTENEVHQYDSEEESRDPTHDSQSERPSQRDMTSPIRVVANTVPQIVVKKSIHNNSSTKPTEQQKRSQPDGDDEPPSFHGVEIGWAQTTDSFF